MSENDEWPVEIRRSKQRAKTISARVENGRLIILAPEKITEAELNPIIERLQKRLKKRLQPTPQTDEELEIRAIELNELYFNGRLTWHSIRYVSNQTKRFGSCTPSQGTIRLSDRLATMPKWVRDYVLVHELAHLVEPNHGRRFWKLVNRYPLTERARGYLMAVGLEEEEG